jgi:hypothetical protein
MLHSSEDQKHSVVEQAAGLASAHAAAISGDARAIRHFVQAFYEHVPPDDVVGGLRVNTSTTRLLMR